MKTYPLGKLIAAIPPQKYLHFVPPPVLFQIEPEMAEAQASFTSVQLQVVMKFLFLQGKSAKDIHTEMSQTLGEKGPSYSTVKTWISSFKTGHFTVEDEPQHC